VASVGVGQGNNAVGANGACIGEREDELLKCYLANVQVADNANARGLTSLQTAALLYKAGNNRAAKEVLCEQRDMYNNFRRIGSPCMVRADWELKGPLGQALTANAPAAPATFSARAYRNRADCLTAAYTAHVALSACDAR
jgi:hypothetical protein